MGNFKILRLIYQLLVLAMFTGACATMPIAPGTQVDYDVIVVGGGLGGLSSAAHLSLADKKVLLLEQHYKVGGCASSFVRGDFAFDTALHEMSLGGGEGVVKQLMEKAGVASKVEFIQVPDLGRSIFPGMEIVQKEGADEFAAELIKHWPDEADNIHAFLALMEEMSQETRELKDLYFSNPVKATVLKVAIPFRQPKLAKYFNNTLSEVLDDYFEDEKLKAAISQFWVYHGPPPDDIWSIIYLLAQQSYVKNGGWQFKGSSAALSEAYADRIRELGGAVHTSTKVEKIIIKNGRVAGVKTAEGEILSSRYVVSNADPFQTYYRLVGTEHAPRKILRELETLTPATSIAGVYLGLDVPLPELGIDDYEVFYNTSWDHNAMNKAMIEGRFQEGIVAMTFYSNLPDTYYAPADKGAMVLHTYSDWNYWSKDPKQYQKQKKKMVDALISVAENVIPSLRDHIVYKEGMTPRTINHYTLSYQGSAYGAAFTVDQSDRMPIQTDITGLYMAGSWVFPSHSVGMAQVSGYMAARMIIKKDKEFD